MACACKGTCSTCVQKAVRYGDGGLGVGTGYAPAGSNGAGSADSARSMTTTRKANMNGRISNAALIASAANRAAISGATPSRALGAYGNGGDRMHPDHLNMTWHSAGGGSDSGCTAMTLDSISPELATGVVAGDCQDACENGNIVLSSITFAVNQMAPPLLVRTVDFPVIGTKRQMRDVAERVQSSGYTDNTGYNAIEVGGALEVYGIATEVQSLMLGLAIRWGIQQQYFTNIDMHFASHGFMSESNDVVDRDLILQMTNFQGGMFYVPFGHRPSGTNNGTAQHSQYNAELGSQLTISGIPSDILDKVTVTVYPITASSNALREYFTYAGL